MQGQLYTIEDRKILTFGGGFNSNLTNDMENNNWWPEKGANKQCIDLVIKNIEKERGSLILL